MKTCYPKWEVYEQIYQMLRESEGTCDEKEA